MGDLADIRKLIGRVTRVSLIKLVLCVVLVIALYYSTLAWLIHDWQREDYSHSFLVPFIVLYLIWDKRAKLASTPSVSSWGGLLALLPGLAIFWLGELGGEFFTLYISFWLVIVGLAWMNIGWRKLKIIGFAMLMLLAMFPLPNIINVKLTSGLKLISSHLGVRLIQLYGLSAYREGNVIDLGFTQLQVVDACSGLRYLFPLLVMGILLAYFYRAAMWKRIVLVLSTIPLTIVTNSLRIALTGIIYKHWGAATAEGFFHGFSGWLIFIFTLVVLLGEIWVLRRIAPHPGESFFESSESLPDTRKEPLRSKATGFLSPPQYVAAVALLAICLGVSLGIEFREKTPAVKPVSHFPLAVAEWKGTRQYMGQEFLKDLDLTDYVVVDFKNTREQPVNFYVAYYESQRKGESIHSPESCLPAGGWSFKQAGKTSVTLSDGRAMTVQRAVMEKSGYHQISYYWFPMRGRVLTNMYEVKYYTFLDALTRQRTDGALVRLITPVMPGETAEQAEERLRQFTREIVPVLDQFLPK